MVYFSYLSFHRNLVLTATVWIVLSPQKRHVDVLILWLWNKVFVDVKLKWGHTGPIWLAFLLEEKRHRQTGTTRQRLEWCTSKPRNTKDCWKPPVAGWDKEGFFPQVFGESMALLTSWFWISSLQNWENKFCCSKSPRLDSSSWKLMLLPKTIFSNFQ